MATDSLAFSGQKTAVFGLGDSHFPKFCTSVDVMEEWLASKQQPLAIASLKIDGYPGDATQATAWIDQFLQH